MITPGRLALPALLLTLILPVAAFAQTAPLKNNEEMKAIFIADQTDRGNNPYAKPGDPQPSGLPADQVRKNDDARDLRVKAMLNEGALQTGTDFYRAALVFQHSGIPEDTLLAHILAVSAVSKGEPSGLWLSAATLDRYLIQTGQAQVFGTQFKSLPKTDDSKPYQFAQDKFDPSLLSDPLRAAFCVAPLAEQQRGLPGPPKGTGLTPCPAHDAMTAHQAPAANQPKTPPHP